MKEHAKDSLVRICLMCPCVSEGWLPIEYPSVLNTEFMEQIRWEKDESSNDCHWETFYDCHWETLQFNLYIKSQLLFSEICKIEEFGVAIEFEANDNIGDDVKKGEKLKMELQRNFEGSIIILTTEEFRIFKCLWKDIFRPLFERLRILAESSDKELDLEAKMLISGIEDKEIMENTLKVLSSSKEIRPGFIFLSKDPDEKNKKININSIISGLWWDHSVVMINLNNGSTYVAANPDSSLCIKEILAGAGIKNFCNKGAFFNSEDEGLAIAAIMQSM